LEGTIQNSPHFYISKNNLKIIFFPNNVFFLKGRNFGGGEGEPPKFPPLSVFLKKKILCLK
jgi:hypothetical protein